jgi:hypothetical protein
MHRGRPVLIAAVVVGLLIPLAANGERTAAAATPGPALSLDVGTGRHPISPLIYGLNSYGVDPALSAELRVPIQRWGGDGTTRYNWQLDSSNAGADWYFMAGSGTTTPTASTGPDALVDKDLASGGQTLMTIPIIPWIDGVSTTDCSYPVSLVGPQQSVNPYVHPNGTDCGNSLAPDGSQLPAPDPARINVANSPAFEAAWVQHFVAKYGDAAHGGVGIYEMDNEPGGWGNTDRDVHPGATGWDELIGLTESYAAAVKAADPTAAIDGPGDFGWPVYVGGGKPGDDQASHGGVLWQAQYYLQQMAAYQAAHGTRLLDYFDEHYYPTTPTGVGCLALCTEGDAATQAARLQSTRSLWDPTYVESDWIGQYYGDIDLIPRMHDWVDGYYPGTKTAISEYNFGGLESVNGALTEADALGIFGREGLDLATLWGPPTSSQPGAFAFRMYRNYDGQHSTFGDEAISATSADQGRLAVYGAQRSADGALTAMVVNKTGGDLTSPISLSGFSPAGNAQVWTYSGANTSAITRGADLPVSATGTTATFPADSITLLVLPQAPATALPTGWTQADIGAVGKAGSATFANQIFTVTGAGADIGGRADAFHLVDEPLAGDGTITARVATQTDSSTWAKAGVMMRSTTAAGSPSVLQSVTPADGVNLVSRAVLKGDSVETNGPKAVAPTWVRLIRRGTSVAAYSSTNGTAWTLVGRQTFPGGPALVGLAVTSHNPAGRSTATFDDVVIGP